jgi:hypothetical protein
MINFMLFHGFLAPESYVLNWGKSEVLRVIKDVADQNMKESEYHHNRL